MELRDYNKTDFANDINLAKHLPSEGTTEPQTINVLTKTLFFCILFWWAAATAWDKTTAA